MIKAKYSGLGSSSDSIFNLRSRSESGILAKHMRSHPRTWILTLFISGSLFMTILIWCLHKNTLRPGDTNEWLNKYHDDDYSIIKDQPFDYLKPSVRAVILILCRNREKSHMEVTLRNFEEKFNKKFKYPYVFLNDEEFTSSFKDDITKIINDGSKAKVEFGTVPKEHWSYPNWIDQKRASESRLKMGSKGVPYGGSESYRFMCRYFSGFIHHHPLLQKYDYYWRVEPGVRFTCEVDYDVFKFMRNNGKEYGFVITMEEIAETVTTLWSTIIDKFLPLNPRKVNPINSPIRYFGKPTSNGYNGCHFWSNFEIASFKMFRSKEYQRFFETLDKEGGFFYERWGDAPVHSIAVGLFLQTSQVHYFHDIGYVHSPFSHCPADFMIRMKRKCDCDPMEWSDLTNGSCQNLWNLLGSHPNNIVDEETLSQ